MTLGKQLVIPQQSVDYNVNIPEVVSTLVLSYLDDAVPTVETLVDDTYTTPWRGPPDATVKLIFTGVNKSLANSWVRAGSEFKKAGLDIDEITNLTWITLFKNPWSVKKVKIFNPMPYPALCVFRHMAADKTTVVGVPMTVLVPAGAYYEYDISMLTINNKAAGASVYLYVGVSLYDKNTPMNVITLNVAGGNATGFFLPFSQADPETGVPAGPQISLDCFNIIDQYGLGVASAAAMFTGVELAYSALAGTDALKSLALSAGVGVGSLAGIIVAGIYEGWLDMEDVTRLLLPSLGVAVSPIAGQAVMSGIANKYSGMGAALLSLAAGGAAVAGELVSAWVLINMVDDITLYSDA